MDKFLDTELTEYESIVLINIAKRLMKDSSKIPTTDDILHEIIRLSEITIKHLK